MTEHGPDRPESRWALLEAYRFRLLFVALAFLLAAASLDSLLPEPTPLASLAVSFVLIAILVSVSRSRVAFIVGAVLALPTFASLWIPSLPEAEPVGLAARTLLYSLGGIYVLRYVGTLERIGEDAVVAALCSWMLFASAFATLFLLVDFYIPGAFSSGGDSADRGSELLYMSFVTLTTLGYGDIVPVADLARSLVILESMLGILYPSMVVARLVSLYAAGGRFPQRRPGDTSPLRNSLVWLLAALVISVVAGAAFETGQGRRLLALAESAMLVAALMAVRRGRGTLIAGLALVFAAMTGALWEAAPTAVRATGAAAEVTLLGLVILGIASREFRGSRVTSSTLVAAAATFFLIGWMFANAFLLIELWQPGALSGTTGQNEWDLIYLSFMTLTTTGYGDITPVTEPARMLAAGVASLGIFFPAVLVARLVSLYDADEEAAPDNSIPGSTPGSNPSTRP